MKKPAGLLPSLAMPMAGWILTVIGAITYARSLQIDPLGGRRYARGVQDEEHVVALRRERVRDAAVGSGGDQIVRVHVIVEERQLEHALIRFRLMRDGHRP